MNWTADFPILAADENGKRLVYLDSAATTQHPTQVLNAVVNYYTKENANPHRGVYELAMRATDAHEGARHTVAQFFNAEDDEIVFTQNTTESLNLIAYSYGMNFLHEGDEIVVSVAEHRTEDSGESKRHRVRADTRKPRRDQDRSDRGSDIRAHDDVYRLPQGHKTGIYKANNHYSSSRGALYNSSNSESRQQSCRAASRQPAQHRFKPVSGAPLQCLSHHIHSEQEQAQPAYHR